MQKEKCAINSVSARRLRFSASRACLHALTALVVVFATGLLPVSAQNDATNRPPVQTFYLPIPEEDLLDTLTKIHGGANWTLPAEPIESYNSIVVFVDGTVIYYDQWEDGYEQDIANPNHIYSASNPTGTQRQPCKRGAVSRRRRSPSRWQPGNYSARKRSGSKGRTT